MDEVKKEQRIQSIDLLKGIAILFVIITHFSWTDTERLYGGFVFWIEMAVPIFILVSGYVNSISYNRKEIRTLDSAFTLKNLLKPFIRYTLPFLIVYIIEAIIYLGLSIFGVYSIPWTQYFYALLTGAWGPGGYYYLVMLQFIIFFPFMYIGIKKFGWKALLICFMTNVLWEFLKKAFSVSDALYGSAIFRYTFLIGCGCYFASVEDYLALTGKNGKADKIVNYILWGGVLVGVAFQIVTQYTSYNPYIFDKWTSTCMIAVLLVIPFFNLIVTRVKKLPKAFAPIEYLGKASYHIYFAQMVYYNFADGVVLDWVNNKWIALFIGIILCVALGIIFYITESKLSKIIIDKCYKQINNNVMTKSTEFEISENGNNIE